MGRAGWDWCCIDTQHGLIGYDAMVPMLQALSAAGCPPVVRVEWNDPATIMKTLDAGAEGVIVPMVNSVEQARAAVAACRYAPEGSRSWGPMRARMLNPEYSVESGRDPICAVMIETVEAIASLEQILDQVSGLDTVFVGPNDLAVSMGVRGSSYAGENPEHRAAMERIGELCQARGITAGIMCGSPEVAEQWRRKGFRMLAVGNDAVLLAGAAGAAARRSRELRAEETRAGR
jgi:4-hydroxy-2-oxoheptanedioate aldolase